MLIDYEREMFELIANMMMPLMLISLISIVCSVFLALCVYNDAKAKNNQNAVMWAVLSGFFNIVALIYIIVQAVSKPKTVYCPRCGNIIPAGYAGCPVCGTPMSMMNMAPAEEQVAKYKKRRWIFLGLFIGFYVLSVIVSVVFMGDFMRQIMELSYEMTAI